MASSIEGFGKGIWSSYYSGTVLRRYAIRISFIVQSMYMNGLAIREIIFYNPTSTEYTSYLLNDKKALLSSLVYMLSYHYE